MLLSFHVIHHNIAETGRTSRLKTGVVVSGEIEML